jgi:hypothetical protein
MIIEEKIMRQVTCMCETVFDADLPEEVDIDSTPGTIDEILRGEFMAATCPSCGARLKPELRVRLVSQKGKLDIVMLPEQERTALYLGKAGIPRGAEAVVGYAELFERAKMLSEGLDPETIEILKYFLIQKAEEQAPEAEISVSYAGKKDGKLSFHLTGLKEGQVAVLPVDPSTYAKTLADKPGSLLEAPFDRLFKGPYRSIRMLETEDED